MSKKIFVVLSAAVLLSLLGMSSQNAVVYADASATAAATKEAKTSPLCSTTTTGADTHQQPKVAKIAAAYGVAYTEILGWFCKGFGLGQIDLAYALAKASASAKTPLTTTAIFNMLDSGKSWHDILAQTNLSMKDVQQARRAAYKKTPKGQGKGKGHNKGNKTDNASGL